MMNDALPMTHDGTPIVEVNQATWAWSFRQQLIIQLEASIKKNGKTDGKTEIDM